MSFPDIELMQLEHLSFKIMKRFYGWQWQIKIIAITFRILYTLTDALSFALNLDLFLCSLTSREVSISFPSKSFSGWTTEVICFLWAGKGFSTSTFANLDEGTCKCWSLPKKMLPKGKWRGVQTFVHSNPWKVALTVIFMLYHKWQVYLDTWFVNKFISLPFSIESYFTHKSTGYYQEMGQYW